MAHYRLGSICQIISGSTPKTGVQEYWNGDKKWITPAELSESDYIIYDTERKLTEAGVKSAGLTPLPKGTVILSSRAPIGKVAIAGCEMYCNQGFKNFVCSNIINNKYLYWYLRSKTDFLNSLGRGATFKEISKSTVADIELDIPELSEQSKRVAHLEKLQSIIASWRVQLAKLDELVKCRFVEMFKHADFPKEVLSSNVTEMFIGPFGSSLKNECFVSQDEAYCVVYEQKHAILKSIEMQFRYVNYDKYNELKRFTILPGDLIMSCRGTIGEMFIVPPNAPLGIMHPSIMKIRLNEKSYDSMFFFYLLSDFMEKNMDKSNGGVVKMAITAKSLGNTYFSKPPLELQQTFSSFVRRIDKLRIIGKRGRQKA